MVVVTCMVLTVAMMFAAAFLRFRGWRSAFLLGVSMFLLGMVSVTKATLPDTPAVHITEWVFTIGAMLALGMGIRWLVVERMETSEERRPSGR